MAKHVPVGKPVNDAEAWAFKFLKENLPDEYILITNVEVYSDNNQPFECDAIVVGEWGIYVIDVKGYQGRLNASKDVWKHNGNYVENPLSKLNSNARILASRCKRILKHNQHAPWCQATIFITGGLTKDIIISTGAYDLPVYSPEKIIIALTSSEYITANFKHKLVQYQKDLAIQAICDFKLITDKNNKTANYNKIEKISSRDGIELWLVEPIGHTFDIKYWMKYVDVTSKTVEEINVLKNKFKKEYYLLSELSDLPTVPVVLTYYDDGESLALVHQRITGLPLTECLNSNHINTLAAVVESLIHMQLKGIVHRALSLETIYISENDKVQLLDVGSARFRGTETIVSASQLETAWLPPEYIENGVYLEKSASFQLAAVFLPVVANVLPNSTSTLEFIEEDYEFVLREEYKNIDGLEDWFKNALLIDIDERPYLEEVLNCITATSNNDVENNNSFSLVENAIVNGKYQLIKFINKGGTSSVWLAKHLIGEYECCLKILDSFSGSDDIAKKEFEILRTLYHPHIVRIFDLDIIPNTDHYFLTSEYLDGDTLGEIEDVSLEEYSGYFYQILSALQYLHRLGRIHKDIKPDNIIIVSNKACLIDFNISSLESRLLGTTRYKDPLVKEVGWTEFSDIYSLVISFVEVITGVHPFQDNDEIPSTSASFSISNDLYSIPSALKSKFIQVLDRKVEWNGIHDYGSWFEIINKPDIVLSKSLKNEWNINDGYMSKVLRVLLADMQPRSRSVIIKNTLKAHDIVGNKSNKGSVNAAISSLKRENLIEEHGKKIKLTDKFIETWETTKL